MNTENIRKLMPKGELLQNESMSRHTSFRTGGNARLFAVPADTNELASLIRYVHRNQLPYFILGNGTNLLVSDHGYNGLVIHLGRVDGTEFVMLGYEETDGGILFDAGCGCVMSVLASIAEKLGCTGFEALSGIPGCIGGACIMNAGAYGSEIKDIVKGVTAVTADGTVKDIPINELTFRYRGSSLRDEELTVARVQYFLPYGNKDDITRLMREYSAKRKEKQPLEYPSAGSTFKRPEGHFAGKLIEESGLKGFRIGGAQVSEKHCGFLINADHACSMDIYHLIRHVQETVYKTAGVRLEPEVLLLGEFNDEQ